MVAVTLNANTKPPLAKSATPPGVVAEIPPYTKAAP